MPIYVEPTVVHRRVWPSRAMVNGVWRANDSYAMVNGVWRQTHEHTISPGNIMGFRICYVRDAGATSEEYPELVSTKQLPIKMLLTGDTRGFMDLGKKGVIFEYSNLEPEWEGICMYRATMYAVFVDGSTFPLYPIGSMNIWKELTLSDISIQIDAYEYYESYGYYISGWNSIYHKKQFIKDKDFHDKSQIKNFNLLDNYDILPEGHTSEEFSPQISIGIARSLTADGLNMVGSYGALDHTWRAIFVNGEPKPFVIEIYH